MKVINELKKFDSLSGKWEVIGENISDDEFETKISSNDDEYFGFERVYYGKEHFYVASKR